jgi:multidrug efflux pump subunit AcrA (membrane-fusion protein)
MTRYFLLIMALTGLVTGCHRAAEPQAKPVPAAQTKTVKEDSLATVTLTPEAEKRLGITNAPVEKRKMQRTRTLPGEVILPLAGTNYAQSIYGLLPAVTPNDLIRIAELQADADAQILTARVQLDAARVTLGRSEMLLTNKAGSVRGVDDARAQVALTESNLKAAENRRRLLGAPVFDAARQDVVWVRTPVYVADVRRLSVDQPAHVGTLGDAPGAAGITARPVKAPFSSTPGTVTIDLFYEARNTNSALRPGQKVSVTLRLDEEENRLAVPWAAIIHDAYGGTWVYEQIAPQTYARRRVLLSHVTDGYAALETGPAIGAKVATAGVPELFGTEMGFAK